MSHFKIVLKMKIQVKIFFFVLIKGKVKDRSLFTESYEKHLLHLVYVVVLLQLLMQVLHMPWLLSPLVVVRMILNNKIVEIKPGQ